MTKRRTEAASFFLHPSTIHLETPQTYINRSIDGRYLDATLAFARQQLHYPTTIGMPPSGTAIAPVAAKPAVPPPSLQYVNGLRRAERGHEQSPQVRDVSKAKGGGHDLNCCPERCWCVSALPLPAAPDGDGPLHALNEWMLTDTRAHVPPSACGKALCFCDDAYPRVPNGIKDTEEIKAHPPHPSQSGTASPLSLWRRPNSPRCWPG